MDIPLKHVIGTIALIGLIISATLAYTIITSYIEADVAKKQLQQIAEHVALNLVEIISLVNFAHYSTTEPMIKILNLPVDLGGKAYTIQLINKTNQGEGCYVTATLVSRTDVTASSLIPLNSTQTQLTLITDTNGNFTLGKNEIMRYSGIVYGGTEEIRNSTGQIIGQRQVAVWGLKYSSNTTWAGIGLWTYQTGG
jgi:hypothetical protein